MNFKKLAKELKVIDNTFKGIDPNLGMSQLTEVRFYLKEAEMWVNQYLIYLEPAGYSSETKGFKDTLPEDCNSVSHIIYLLENQLERFTEFVTSEEEIIKQQETYSPRDNVHTSMCLFNIYSKITEAIMWLRISQ